MESSREFIPPEKSRKLFDLMHRVVDGEIEPETIVDELGRAKATESPKPKVVAVPDGVFRNGMSAFDEWQREKENKEDEKHHAA